MKDPKRQEHGKNHTKPIGKGLKKIYLKKICCLPLLLQITLHILLLLLWVTPLSLVMSLSMALVQLLC